MVVRTLLLLLLLGVGADVACPPAGSSQLLQAVASWAADLDAETGEEVASIVRRERLDGDALGLITAEQLHQLGVPLGVALKLKRCFGSDSWSSSSSSSSSWRTVAVTGARPLVITNDTEYPSTTAIVVTDGGVIRLRAGATLTIRGSFSAPLQQVFAGPGRVLMNGDAGGKLYPQWWGAVADGKADAGAAIQKAVLATTQFPYDAPAAQDFSGANRSATVFMPPGVYSISATIELPDRASLMGAGSGATHLVANRTSAPAALIAPPNNGHVRTDGWRLSGFSLQGDGKSEPDGHGGQKLVDGSTNATGLFLIQTSRAIVHDIGIAQFQSGLRLDGRWNNGSDDGHGHGEYAIPCMYNSFYDVQVGQCSIGVNVNYSIANRFHNFIVGAIDTGFYLNGTNQLDIYSPTIEGFNVGIDAMYGDTTHVYNAYLGNDGQGVGVRVWANMSESAIISPRLDHISIPIINDSPTTIVLYWDSPGDPPSRCNLPPQCHQSAPAPAPAWSHCQAPYPYEYGDPDAGLFCCANKTSTQSDCPSSYCCLTPGSTSGCQSIARCGAE